MRTRTGARVATGHAEEHFTAGDVVRDIVIGMLMVPFAFAAGISGAVASTHLVVTAGLAQVAARSIAMGLGGFLAARGEAEHYDRERRHEGREVAREGRGGAGRGGGHPSLLRRRRGRQCGGRLPAPRRVRCRPPKQGPEGYARPAVVGVGE